MTNFEELLGKRGSEVERPKPLPEGTYFGPILGYEFGESSQKKTPKVDIKLRAIRASEDVDPDELEAYGGLSEKSNAYVTFYLTEDALYRLTEFLVDHVGLNGENSIREMLDEAVGQEVGFVIEHNVSDRDPTRIYTNVARTLAAE